MPRVVHFDISADRPERAIKFYSEVFGWMIQKWEGPMDYWLIHTGEGPGIDGGLGKRLSPSDSTTVAIGVLSVDEYQAKIKKAAARLLFQRWLFQESDGLQAVRIRRAMSLESYRTTVLHADLLTDQISSPGVDYPKARLDD